MSQGYDDDFDEGAAPAVAPQDALVELNALLGRGTRYSGKLHFDGRVRIEGAFDGEIRGEDVLVIGEGAEVDGSIEVGCCIVTGGTVRANIRAVDAIELHAPAVVFGDLHAPNIFIDRGVQFEGSCKMAPLTGRPPPVIRAAIKTIEAQPLITASSASALVAVDEEITGPTVALPPVAPTETGSAQAAPAAQGDSATAAAGDDEYDEYDDYDDDEYEDDEYDDEYEDDEYDDEYEDEYDDESPAAAGAVAGAGAAAPDAHLAALEPQARKRSRRKLPRDRHGGRAKRPRQAGDEAGDEARAATTEPPADVAAVRPGRRRDHGDEH